MPGQAYEQIKINIGTEHNERAIKGRIEKGCGTFFDAMANALAQGERVEIRGLCAFKVKEYPSYVGRNPKTGELVTVKPKKLPFFKPGTDLKKRANR